MLRLFKLTICCISLCMMIGCGGKSASDLVVQLNDTNIERLANLYNRYQAENLWYGPDTEQELRDYIQNDVPDFIKERIGFTNVDDLFISQRDGQPFKIKFGVIGTPVGCNEPAIFEQEGKNGKRLVGFLNMTNREVESAEYDELWNRDPAAAVGGSS